MKRLIKNIFLITMIISILLCACSCGGNNGMKRYSESGLIFSLPTYMQKFSVEYADLCYGNHEKNLEFFVYFYGSDSLLTQLYLPTDCTVKDYAEWFVNMNEYEDVLEFYDEENARIVLEYIYVILHTRINLNPIHVAFIISSKIQLIKKVNTTKGSNRKILIKRFLK